MPRESAAREQRSAVIDIEGMHCASCVRRVERALSKVDGVSEATVNLATNRAHVTLDASASVAPAVAAIEKAGYSAQVASAEQIGPELSDHFPVGRLIAAAVLAIAVFAGSMRADSAVQIGTIAVLSGASVFWVGAPLFKAAWGALVSARTATMDTLVVLGSSAAWGFSVAEALAGHYGDTYFDTSSTIIAFILLGRWLEDRAKRRAGDAMRGLAALIPARATALAADGSEVPVEVASVRIGDQLRVRPGERFAVDAEVVAGDAAVDEAVLTGESSPVHKGAGDAVIGGTVCLDGVVTVRATAVGAHTVVARLRRLVEDAQAGKAPVQRLADRVASVFVPVVLGIAAVTLAGSLLDHRALSFALMHAVAVLLIACPCALGLATPTAIMVASGRAADIGIMVRNGAAIEMLSRIRTVIFDKTGTLTDGQMHVARIAALNGQSESDVLRVAAEAELGSEHPVAKAIVAKARGLELPLARPESFRSFAGEGVRAMLDGGRTVVVGSESLLRREGAEIGDGASSAIASLRSSGGSVALVAVDGAVVGAVAVADRLRPEAAEAVVRLRAMGVDVAMLSGDHRAAARAIAGQAGIEQVESDVSPEQKLGAVRRRQSETAGGFVAMVGDGVNDAAALAQASVGIAMASATDVAVGAADVSLLHANLHGVADAIALARATMTVIRQNLWWAFLFNVIGIPLAALGFLSPIIAAGAMAMSSVIVVSNSLRLRRWRVRRAA